MIQIYFLGLINFFWVCYFEGTCICNKCDITDIVLVLVLLIDNATAITMGNQRINLNEGSV